MLVNKEVNKAIVSSTGEWWLNGKKVALAEKKRSMKYRNWKAEKNLFISWEWQKENLLAEFCYSSVPKLDENCFLRFSL